MKKIRIKGHLRKVPGRGLGHHQAVGWKVYSYDTQSDTWLLIAVKDGTITKGDLESHLPPGYHSLFELRLIKPISFPKSIHKMDYDTARTYIHTKDKEFGGVF